MEGHLQKLLRRSVSHQSRWYYDCWYCDEFYVFNNQIKFIFCGWICQINMLALKKFPFSQSQSGKHWFITLKMGFISVSFSVTRRCTRRCRPWKTSSALTTTSRLPYLSSRTTSKRRLSERRGSQFWSCREREENCSSICRGRTGPKSSASPSVTTCSSWSRRWRKIDFIKSVFKNFKFSYFLFQKVFYL